MLDCVTGAPAAAADPDGMGEASLASRQQNAAVRILSHPGFYGAGFQAVFAYHLNMATSLVRQSERGEKCPRGAEAADAGGEERSRRGCVRFSFLGARLFELL